MARTNRKNWHLKLISLVLALLLWGYVSNVDLIMKKKVIPDVKLNVINLDSRLSARFSDQVQVSISGVPRRAEEIYAYLDLAGKGPGEYDLPVKIKSLPGTRISEIKPDRVRVEVAEIQEFVFPVAYRVEKPPPEGYELTGVEVVPDRCVVRGSQKQVNQVASLVVLLNLDNITSTATVKGRVQPLDRRGRPLQGELLIIPEEVKNYIVVEKEQGFARAAINVSLAGELPPGLEVERVTVMPTEVTLVGAAREIEGITVVDTEPLDLTGRDRSFKETVSLVPGQGIKLFPSKVEVMVEIGTSQVEKR